MLNIIAAIGRNLVLGNKNQLIWRISDDLKRFKELTSNHPVIMGRKTFESIGKPLPNRTNIVITRNSNFKPAGVQVTDSVSEAIGIASMVDTEIFIIGGAEIYKETIGMADRLYLTVINEEKDGDAFFPTYEQFKKVISTENKKTDTGLEYQFLVLER